jgi:hypothetical protein
MHAKWQLFFHFASLLALHPAYGPYKRKCYAKKLFCGVSRDVSTQSGYQMIREFIRLQIITLYK